MAASQTSMLKRGLAYAKKGWAVFPLHSQVNGVCTCRNQECRNPAKHPRVEGGLKAATTDPDTITGWWTTWPNANIGVRTGAGSGIVVVDTDIKHDGPTHWSDLQDIHGPIETLTGLTGGGGNHWVFQAPLDRTLKNTAGRLGRGIDTRGEGGYIVAPPSLHISGDRYEWDHIAKIAPVPDWVLGLWSGSTNGDVIGEGHRPAEPIGDEIPQGKRNHTLTSLAGSMRHRGMSEQAILAALMVENRTRCRPPLPEAEVRAIAASAARYPAGEDLESEAVKEWTPRQDLPPERPPVPSLPLAMIPEPIRPWLADLACRACVPLEMVACPAIVSLGALTGRKIGIRPSCHDDYLVVPNLWGGIIARPGAMKTYDIEQGTTHLRRLATVAHDRSEADREDMEAHQDRLNAEISATKDEMRKVSKKNGDLDQLQAHLAELKRNLNEATVVEKRYMTQDATVEKLGELLRENPDGILVLRDELAGWLRTLDKPGREGDREFYLEGWNGTGDYTFDRIQRGTVRIPAVCISIFGGIQPGKLSSYIQEALAESGGADGLLQRLQLTVWPDNLGPWQKADRWPDHGAKNRAFEVYQSIDALDHLNLGIECEDGSIPAVRFTNEAQDLFDSWRDELENRLRSDELTETPAFESHLSKYRSLMPSLALIFYLVDYVASGTSGTAIPAQSQTEFPMEVPIESAQLAAAWCDYLEVHARKIYSAELYPGRESAHYLASKIEQGAIMDGQPIRDIYRHHWAGLTTAASVDQAIGVLADCGWVRTESLDTGGRPTEILRLHPDLSSDNGN